MDVLLERKMMESVLGPAFTDAVGGWSWALRDRWWWFGKTRLLHCEEWGGKWHLYETRQEYLDTRPFVYHEEVFKNLVSGGTFGECFKVIERYKGKVRR